MAKIQNIYAIASDGTKITVTASAVGAVPTNQVATSSVLGLIKTGDNTIQGQENGVDVNYLEVNAAGKGFMPAFNINNYIDSSTGGEKYFVVKFALNGHTDTPWYYITNEVPILHGDTYYWHDEGPKLGYSLLTDEGGSTYKVTSSPSQFLGTTVPNTYFYSDGDGSEIQIGTPIILYTDASSSTQKVKLTEILDGTLKDTFTVISCNYYTYSYRTNDNDRLKNLSLGSDLTKTDTELMFELIGTVPYETYTANDTTMYFFNLPDVSIIDSFKTGNPEFDRIDSIIPMFWWNGDEDKVFDLTNLGTTTLDEKTVCITLWGIPVGYNDKPSVIGSTVVPNRIILNDNKKLIVDIDNFQHATTSQYGIVQFPADYYEDDGTPKIATTDKQGTLKIGTEYSAYTTEGSYTAAPLLLNSSNVGYVEVLPATTSTIGSIMVSDSSIYDASTISNKTIAWVNLNGNKAFVYVNLASQQYRGSVRVQQKYTAYATLDSQTAAYLRITDAGYGYVTVLPATTSAIGSFKAASKQTEYVSTDGNWCAPLEIASSTSVGFVRVFPATSSIIGSVGVTDKYTAYSTEDSQTAAYLRINSAGRAYTPMLTEAWTFTVLNDDDTETDVVKNVVLG